MAKGDKVTGAYYMTRSDSVKLFRFAVPNTKTGDEWDKPRFKIRQDQTGILYDEVIDVEIKDIHILKPIFRRKKRKKRRYLNRCLLFIFFINLL